MIDGETAIAWIESYCRVPKGPAVGRPVRLLDYQRQIVGDIFDTPTRRAIVSMGRQNAKTTLCAYLLLLHLVGPRHQVNGLLVSSALTREQAAILFDAAAKITRLSPELEAVIDIAEHTKVLRCRDLGTMYRALSADALPQLGLSPFFIVHDELGGVEGPYSKLYDVLESGSAVQADPLSLIISTQARSDGDLLSRLIDDAATGADPRTRLFLWTAPPEADPWDEETWRMANPALGHFLRIEEVRGQAETAKRMPSMEASFRNLILNQRVDATSQFVSASVWRANGEAPGALDGAVVDGGLDLSSVHDLTALVLVAEDGSVHVFAWLPEDGIEEKSRLDKVEYAQWARDGHLLTTPGKAINYDHVARELRAIFNRCTVRRLAFDRVFMKFLRPCLIRAGFTEKEIDDKFVEHGQGFIGMAPAIRELEVRLLEGRLKHGMHPVLTMCAANAAVVTDDAGNRKFTKRKSIGRIDALVSLAMAVSIIPGEPPKPLHQSFLY
jgi:phage terminase large subunit-like protein